jgi:hypothetical protein
VTSTYGLSGELRIQRGRYLDTRRERRGTVLHTTVFQDERFTYLLRLTTTEEHREPDGKVFRDLMSSVRPLPHPLARESDLWSAWHKAGG